MLTNNQLISILVSPGENSNIDAKGPMEWDTKTQSASLTKHILAMRNTPGGGYLIIGKSQLNGNFVLEGLSDTQLKSFDVTNVSRWVNNYSVPNVPVQCYPIRYDNKNFIIIEIPDNNDDPSICIKDFTDDKNGKTKQILHQGCANF